MVPWLPVYFWKKRRYHNSFGPECRRFKVVSLLVHLGCSLGFKPRQGLRHMRPALCLCAVCPGLWHFILRKDLDKSSWPWGACFPSSWCYRCAPLYVALLLLPELILTHFSLNTAFLLVVLHFKTWIKNSCITVLSFFTLGRSCILLPCGFSWVVHEAAVGWWLTQWLLLPSFTCLGLDTAACGRVLRFLPAWPHSPLTCLLGGSGTILYMAARIHVSKGGSPASLLKAPCLEPVRHLRFTGVEKRTFYNGRSSDTCCKEWKHDFLRTHLPQLK